MKAARYAASGTCEAIISGRNPRLPRSLPVYRLLTAETSCDAVDLPFSGVPKYSCEGDLLFRGGVLQQIEYIAQANELRFSCENGQFNITRSVFLRIEHISADSMCIHCNDFLVRINGVDAAIEIDAIVRIAKKYFFAENAGYRRQDSKSSAAQDILGFYSVLGVEPNSSQDTIKKAYKKKCLEVHPDVNKSDNAQENFVQLRKAYEILGNAEERSKYDAQCIEVPNVKSSTVNDTTESDNTFEPIRCSICDCVSAQPRYVVFWETISFFSSIRSPVQGVMCTKCAGNAALQATRKSLIFGWWGIWGLIFTPMSVIGNMAGGSKPPENNGRILLHQSWYFAQNGRLDLAYFLANDAHRYLKATLNNEVASLISISQSIMENCKPFADGKELDHVWDRALPRLGDQWKTVVICAAAWTFGLSALNGYLEGRSQKAIEGAPKYTYQMKESSSPPADTPSSPKPVEAEPPPIPRTYLPLITGYLPGKQVADSDGYSEVTLKNNSAGNYHVRLYRKDGSLWVISREVYLKADEEFTMKDLNPGEYEIRRMNVQTKSASKSEAFTLEEAKNSEGVRYSTLTLTLDVVDGNSKIAPITAKEF